MRRGYVSLVSPKQPTRTPALTHLRAAWNLGLISLHAVTIREGSLYRSYLSPSLSLHDPYWSASVAGKCVTCFRVMAMGECEWRGVEAVWLTREKGEAVCTEGGGGEVMRSQMMRNEEEAVCGAGSFVRKCERVPGAKGVCVGCGRRRGERGSPPRPHAPTAGRAHQRALHHAGSHT